MKKRLFFLTTFLLTLLYGLTFAQERTVSGTVTGESGDTLPGATVQIKGTTTGVVTDLEGKYKLAVPAEATTLVISFVGMDDKEVEIGNQSVIDVVMSDSIELSEVVVVGYGEQSEKLSIQNVETIKASSFTEKPVLTVQDALQGQAAGVQMVNSSGVLGAAPSVRIRGVGSIGSGGGPLYVVDGVPLNDASGSSDGYTGGQGGVRLNPLANLNNNDIETITVLKDAAATAIYGSRGSNGVVLIKTKQGKAGEKTSFNFDSFTGVSDPTVLRKMMNADQYRQFGVDLYGINPADYPGNFDWPSAVVQTGKISSYTLGARGGNEKTTFYLGGTFLNQKAYTIGNEVDKLSGRFNITHRATDRLTFGANLTMAKAAYDRIGADNSTFAPLTSAYLQTPWTEPTDANGAYVNTGFIANVLAIEALDVNKTTSFRTTGNAFASFDLMEDLTIKTDFGVDRVFVEKQQKSQEVNSPGGYGYNGIVQDNKWLNTTTLNYSKELNDDHYFGVLLGTSYETSRRRDIDVEGTGYVADALPNVASASTPTTTSSTQTEWALFSLFSRFNYRFKNKYLFEASLRRDGSSRFGKDNRYGIFWAASAGWIISDEAFMDNVSFVDNLKLSASYGTSGNSNIGNFASLGLYSGGQASNYGGNPGIRPTSPANKNLGWEQTAQMDVTLNAGLFNNRLNVEASFYQKKTTDLILDLPIPRTTGFASVPTNVGEMKNTGVDLSITSTNFDVDGFRWTTNLNVGFLNNKVTKLPTNPDAEGRDFVQGSSSQRAIVGNSVNTFYLIRYKGINPETGDAEWLTKDGEVTTTPKGTDRVIAGSAIPKFTGGFTNTFSYKGLELKAFFTFVQGNKLFVGDRRFTDYPAAWGSFNMTTRMLNYWKNPGDQAFAPALTSSTLGSFRQRSTLQLKDGSYVRLKTLSLGYTLPKNMLEKTKFLNRARVYVAANNLLTFTDLEDIDPETSGNGSNQQIQGESFFTAPQARTITVGISLGF